MDYERSNFSVNPCIFSENAQQDISPIKSVEISNEKGTDTRNDSNLIFTRQSLSGPAVARVTIAAVLGLLILLACVTLLAIRQRRRRLRRYHKQAEFPIYPRHFKPASTPDAFQSTRREHELPAIELDFSRNALQGTPNELGDTKRSKYKTEGIKHNPSSQKLRKNSDQYPASTSTCEGISKDISLATSPSSLTSEHITGTANDSDHVVTSPHSNPSKIVELETHNMSSFDVLEAGHWTLEIWPSIAENIRIRYREIMGVGNVGSINLLSCSSPGSTGLYLQYSPAPASPAASPAVCISCKYPDRVNRSLLQEMLGKLKDLPIIVRSGSILRSGFEENCCSVGESCNVCQGKMLTSAFKLGPAAYGRYMQKPDCGASIGVNDPDLEHERVSLGGYILLNLGGRWIPAAVTCHHLVDNSSVETLGIQSRVDGTGDSRISGVKYSIQSSAKIDHDGEVTRLRERVENNGQSSQKVEVTNIMDAYKSLLKAQLCFGEARRSSGISIDAVENLQVRIVLRHSPALVRRIADIFGRWTGCSLKILTQFALESTSLVIQHRSWKAQDCGWVVHGKSQRSTCPKTSFESSCDSANVPLMDRLAAYLGYMAVGARVDWGMVICPALPVSFALARWRQRWNGLSSLEARLARVGIRAHGFSPSWGRS